MLRRDRIVRMQFQQLVDACLFALSFWLAYSLRSNRAFIEFFSLQSVAEFRDEWLFLLIIPAAPMVLEAQGFYSRPLLCSRLATTWKLAKACAFITLGVVVALFLARQAQGMPRWTITFFPIIAFGLVFAKEEALLLFFKTRVARGQLRRRLILVGDPVETARSRQELNAKSPELEIVAELDLGKTPVNQLVELLHEYSVNGVVLSGKRALFDEIEQAIRACELEGVEVWLMADFLKTQACRSTLNPAPQQDTVSRIAQSLFRRDRFLNIRLHQLVDACVFGFSFWLAYTLRSNADLRALFDLAPVTPFEGKAWLCMLLIPAAPLVLRFQGFYNQPLLGARLTTAWMLFKGCALVSLGMVVALFLARQVQEMPRWVVVLFPAVSFGLMLAKEELLLLFSKARRARLRDGPRLLILGDPGETARIREELKAKSPEPIDTILEMNLKETPLNRLLESVRERSLNGVIVSGKRAWFDEIETAIRACERERFEVWLLADFFETQICRTSLDDFYGQPMLVFRTAPEGSWQSIGKQLLDFLGAAILLLLSSPVMVLAAIGVKLTSPGPVLFRQQRSGINGRPFTLYKFRTMVSNAEQLKHELAAMNEMSGPVFKVANDPRITPFGRLLRKFSIDEFPQFYNVLRGEMSLVGPRPLPVDEVKRFNDLAHRRRLSVKPGLTCLWQISGRNNVKDFKDWVRLDLEYIDNWSLWLDFKILCRTVPVVLTGAGAR